MGYPKMGDSHLFYSHFCLKTDKIRPFFRKHYDFTNIYLIFTINSSIISFFYLFFSKNLKIFSFVL